MTGPSERRALVALVKAFVTIDLRGQHYASATGVKHHREVISPFVWVVAQFVATSGLLTALLFARVDADTFALLQLAVLAVVVVSAVLVEASEVLFVPHDRSVLGWRPLTPAVVAGARLVNLVLYVAVVVVACSIFPTIVGATFTDSSLRWLVSYPVAACSVGALAAAVAVAVAMVFARWPGLEVVRQGLAWVQIGLVMVLFYAGQFMLRDGSGALELWSSSPPAWLASVPLWWLAQAVGSVARGEGGVVVLGAAATLALAVGLVVMAVLARGFAQSQPPLLRSVLPPPPQPGTLASSSSLSSASSSRQRAAVALTWLLRAHVQRDRRVREQVVLALATPASAVAVAVVAGALSNPTTVATSDAVFIGAILVLLAGSSTTAVSALRTSDAPGAARRLLLAPQQVSSLSIDAVRATLWRSPFAAAIVGLALVLLWQWRDVVSVLAVVVVAAAIVDVCLGVAARELIGSVPLSLPLQRSVRLTTSWPTLARTTAVGAGLSALLLAGASVTGGVVVAAGVAVLVAFGFRWHGGRDA